MTPLDGNAVAGLLHSAFGREMTTALGTCAECHASSRLGRLPVYQGAGTVLRCPSCGAVLMTIVEHGDVFGVDAQGMSALQ